MPVDSGDKSFLCGAIKFFSRKSNRSGSAPMLHTGTLFESAVQAQLKHVILI